MDNEIWRDIEGFEGRYQVSNMGRIKSLERVDSLGRRVNERILSPGKDGKGYLFVILCKGGERKRYFIHRLCLMTFNPHPDMENLQVNHIDENKTNNHLSNLEWTTCKENINHGTRNDRVAEMNTNGKKSIPIVQLTIEGKFIKAWKSSRDAERGGFTNSSIIACCKGKLKTHKGFRWMYLSEFLDKNCGIID